MRTLIIEVDDLKFEVEGTHFPGTFGSLEQQPEPEQFEINSIKLGDVDVTEFLQCCYNKPIKNSIWFTSKFEEIEQLILLKYYG